MSVPKLLSVLVRAGAFLVAALASAGAAELHGPRDILFGRLVADCRIGPPPIVPVGAPDVMFIIRNSGRSTIPRGSVVKITSPWVPGPWAAGAATPKDIAPGEEWIAMRINQQQLGKRPQSCTAAVTRAKS